MLTSYLKAFNRLAIFLNPLIPQINNTPPYPLSAFCVSNLQIQKEYSEVTTASYLHCTFSKWHLHLAFLLVLLSSYSASTVGLSYAIPKLFSCCTTYFDSYTVLCLTLLVHSLIEYTCCLHSVLVEYKRKPVFRICSHIMKLSKNNASISTWLHCYFSIRYNSIHGHSTSTYDKLPTNVGSQTIIKQ